MLWKMKWKQAHNLKVTQSIIEKRTPKKKRTITCSMLRLFLDLELQMLFREASGILFRHKVSTLILTSIYRP